MEKRFPSAVLMSCVLSLMIVFAQAPSTRSNEVTVKIERLNLPELGLPAGPYSHAVVHGRTLYTSGFTAFGTDSQAGGMAEQIGAIFRQFEIIAASQNASLAELVKVTIFITNPADIPELRTALEKQYGSNVPASSLVIVASLFAPELAVEVEAIFALPG